MFSVIIYFFIGIEEIEYLYTCVSIKIAYAIRSNPCPLVLPLLDTCFMGL